MILTMILVNYMKFSFASLRYSFDMRRMKEAKCVHMDHVGAVMDVDYSPTGEAMCRKR